MENSDYENISFLYADRIVPRIWKGGKETRISKEQYDTARKTGYPPSRTIYGAVQFALSFHQLYANLRRSEQ